tara:strand:- start:918 stop:1082 length:165 start_codon:yes stop_codon:yes gene_type:complete
MTLKELKELIDTEIENEGNGQVELFDAHGDYIEKPEFGFGLRGAQQFTFFRESN